MQKIDIKETSCIINSQKMFDPPLQPQELEKLIAEKAGEWAKPVLFNISQGARKGSITFWMLSRGLIHCGSLRSTPKQGK